MDPKEVSESRDRIRSILSDLLERCQSLTRTLEPASEAATWVPIFHAARVAAEETASAIGQLDSMTDTEAARGIFHIPSDRIDALVFRWW